MEKFALSRSGACRPVCACARLVGIDRAEQWSCRPGAMPAVAWRATMLLLHGSRNEAQPSKRTNHVLWCACFILLPSSDTRAVDRCSRCAHTHSHRVCSQLESVVHLTPRTVLQLPCSRLPFAALPFYRWRELRTRAALGSGYACHRMSNAPSNSRAIIFCAPPDSPYVHAGMQHGTA
jgi:hypothetical protein